ncbi:MAG: formyltransferase family protein [Cohaesibacter sp.]|nr:formyltransferase family protein [Cohaesibacter sp.]
MTCAKSIILLMPKLEAEFFQHHIGQLAPNMAISMADSDEALAKALSLSQHPCILFGFLTPVYVQPDHLSRLAKAYNLHPGPPSRPGYRPTHFAFLQSAKEHGVTLHEMAKRIDTGPILATCSFPITQVDSLEALEEQTYATAIAFALEHLPVILGMTDPAPYDGEEWHPHKMCADDLAKLSASKGFAKGD